MGVEPGSQIGPYLVERELGRGGMGVVYAGRDTRLDRAVAIKALPERLAQDPERLARFEREARLLAQLNHPNVAGIHGVEEYDGARYLVLEYVDGQSLADRLARGPLPVEEAVEIAIGIASGIEAAHEAGVVHRDLKPGNIIVAPNGDVKVLDFGLATSGDQSDSTSIPSESPTLTSPAPISPTIPGVILGTAAYMSPEQARGKPVDKRTDIWSFGVVLYEMLTGLRPFAGETASDSIASILSSQPLLDELPAGTPDTVVRVLNRTLCKDPRERLRDIGDARLELSSRSSKADRPPATRPMRHALAAVTAMSVIVAVIAVGAALTPGPAPPRGTSQSRLDRSVITLPEGSRLRWRGTRDTWSKIGYSQLLAVAPAGEAIMLTVQTDQGAWLHLKTSNEFTPSRIEGGQGGRGAFFSPDGRWVGYLAENNLYKVRLPGGARTPLCEINSSAFGATWLENDTIVFSTDTGLWRVPATGGEPEQLTMIDTENGVRAHLYPHSVPDTQLILFTVGTDTGQHAGLLSLADGQWRIIKNNAAQARSVGGRHLVFARDGEIYSSSFDPATPLAIGTETSIAQGVHRIPGQGGSVVHVFATSDEGTLAFAAPEPEPDALVWVDHLGIEEEIVRGEGSWLHQRLSPDGNRILLNRGTADGMLDLWIYEIDQGVFNRLSHTGSAYDAEWNPLGGTIGFAAMSDRGRAIYLIPSDFSTDQPRMIIDASEGRPHFSQWTPDGSTLLFFDRSSRGGVWASIPEGGALEEVSNTSLGESWAVVSPDNSMIAFVGWNGPRRDVYVQAYPELGRRVRVSQNGGGEPLWGTDSQTLYFRQNGVLYQATIESEPRIDVADIVTLPFEDVYDSAASGHQHYDLSLDGSRFLMVRHGERTHPTKVHVIRNWYASDE